MKMSIPDWDKVMNTDLRPAYFLSKYAFRAFPRIGPGELDGSIVNVSSIVGIVGNSGQENYVAAKAGLIGVTKSLAENLGRRGVRVNTVAPGFIDTDMTRNMDVDPELQEAILAATVTLTPLGRIGTVQEVADAIAFLAGPRASFITGETIIVDGGLGASLHAIPKVMELQREIKKLKGQANP